MELTALYDFAKQQNIEVIPFPMKENGSTSILMDSGDCVIGMDEGIRDGACQERVHLGMNWDTVLPAAFTASIPLSTAGSVTKTKQTNGPFRRWCRWMLWIPPSPPAVQSSGNWQSGLR